ncbi:hypothetical protein CDAR_407821 [Caerostris darwini]|uniref:Uncharacterized protein n=1 Tax=Caerostris darwini TaxID=1538125 RepID=A0AAV4U7P7_9ARAC|nr:hypothetical protein CDAR_407821 [Caerostris darwini]
MTGHIYRRYIKVPRENVLLCDAMTHNPFDSHNRTLSSLETYISNVTSSLFHFFDNTIHCPSERKYILNRSCNTKRIEQITSPFFLAFYQSGQEYYGQVHPSLLSGTLNEDKYARVSMSELNAGTSIGLPDSLLVSLPPRAHRLPWKWSLIALIRMN